MRKTVYVRKLGTFLAVIVMIFGIAPFAALAEDANDISQTQDFEFDDTQFEDEGSSLPIETDTENEDNQSLDEIIEEDSEGLLDTDTYSDDQAPNEESEVQGLSDSKRYILINNTCSASLTAQNDVDWYSVTVLSVGYVSLTFGREYTINGVWNVWLLAADQSTQLGA